MIALTAAQVKDIVDSRRLSNFRLDFLRFWATGEGLKTFFFCYQRSDIEAQLVNFFS